MPANSDAVEEDVIKAVRDITFLVAGPASKQ
jgi:hypothetical protein